MFNVKPRNAADHTMSKMTDLARRARRAGGAAPVAGVVVAVVVRFAEDGFADIIASAVD